MDFLFHNLGKIILSLSIAGLLLLAVKNYAKVKTFLLEVKAELGKVSWPSKDELIGSTAVVFMITGILGVFIGVIDLFLSQVLSLLFK